MPATPTNPQPALLRLDGWMGRVDIPCEIVGETPTRYRIRLLLATNLPSKRSGRVGDVVLVPKHAVRVQRRELTMQDLFGLIWEE